MQQEGTIALFHYWNRLRDGRPAPLRGEVEPADIKKLLADTFILEQDTRGEAVFRLAGTRLCAIYGRELKGFSFPSMWRSRDHKLVLGLLAGVFNDRSVAVIQFRGHSLGGRSVDFEMVILPLDTGRQSDRCLGLMTACERAYWLGADPIVDAVVGAVRVVDPDRDPLFLKNRPAIPISPALVASGSAANDAFGRGNPRRIRHLLVLSGGRDNAPD